MTYQNEYERFRDKLISRINFEYPKKKKKDLLKQWNEIAFLGRNKEYYEYLIENKVSGWPGFRHAKQVKATLLANLGIRLEPYRPPLTRRKYLFHP